MPLRLPLLCASMPAARFLRGAALAGSACLALAACSGSTTPIVAPTSSISTPTPGPSATPTAPAAPSALRTTSPAPVDPLSPRPALESPPPLGRPACAAAALSVVDADAVTTASSLEEVFAVRTSGPDCQLEGYPMLSFTGPDGRPLTVKVDRGGHGLRPSTPLPVTLSRSTSVSFGVATARSGSCQATSRVAVTLPATGRALSAATSMQVCGGSVGVTPIQRRVDADGG